MVTREQVRTQLGETNRTDTELDFVVNLMNRRWPSGGDDRAITDDLKGFVAVMKDVGQWNEVSIIAYLKVNGLEDGESALALKWFTRSKELQMAYAELRKLIKEYEYNRSGTLELAAGWLTGRGCAVKKKAARAIEAKLLDTILRPGDEVELRIDNAHEGQLSTTDRLYWAFENIKAVIGGYDNHNVLAGSVLLTGELRSAYNDLVSLLNKCGMVKLDIDKRIEAISSSKGAGYYVNMSGASANAQKAAAALAVWEALFRAVNGRHTAGVYLSIDSKHQLVIAQDGDLKKILEKIKAYVASGIHYLDEKEILEDQEALVKLEQEVFKKEDGVYFKAYRREQKSVDDVAISAPTRSYCIMGTDAYHHKQFGKPHGDTLSAMYNSMPNATIINGPPQASRPDGAVLDTVKKLDHYSVPIAAHTTCLMLEDIANGTTKINIAAHSRGSVESLIVAHELNRIKNNCNTVDLSGRVVLAATANAIKTGICLDCKCVKTK